MRNLWVAMGVVVVLAGCGAPVDEAMPDAGEMVDAGGAVDAGAPCVGCLVCCDGLLADAGPNEHHAGQYAACVQTCEDADGGF